MFQIRNTMILNPKRYLILDICQMKPTRRSRSGRREIIEFIGDSVDDFSRRGTAEIPSFSSLCKCVN